VKRERSSINGLGIVILAGALPAGPPGRAHPCGCAGPNFWQIERDAKIIVYATVVQHVDHGTREAQRVDFVVRVDEVLRGKSPGATIAFQGGAVGVTDCIARADGFPLGSRWAFILDGGAVLHSCSGRFQKIQPATSDDTLSLDEVKRRLRYRGPARTPPTKTRAGTLCNASARAWVECNDPRVRQYLEGLEDYEQGAHLTGVQLSDGRRVPSGEFVGKLADLGGGAHVYVIRSEIGRAHV
jgi:hypothetical protein